MKNMHNQRGRANGVVIFLIAFAIFAIGFAIILNHSNPGSSRRHVAHGKHIVAKGEFLKPTTDGHGRYTYQADDGNWYIYYWLMTDSNSSYYSSGSYTPLSTLPSGGTWSRAEQPQTEEIVGEQTEEVAEANTGVPETEQEFTTENQDGIENQSVEPENTVEPSNSEPSSPDSSPSDSGGDSGGDGGGDGGGSSD